MYFFLNNIYFEKIILIFLIINVLTSLIILISDSKQKISDNNADSKKMSKLECFKIITNNIYAIFFVILVINIASKYRIMSYIILIYYLFFIWKTFWKALKLSKKNIIDLNSDNKMSYAQASVLFCVFFSSQATNLYMKNFYTISHTIKEYLLIIYLTFKLIFFIYCIIINFSIFVSNLSIIFKKQFKSIKILFNKILNKYFELNLYNFYFSNKKDKLAYLVLDIIIYILSCPFFIIIYFIFALCVLSIKFVIRHILKFCTKIVNYFNNSSKIIGKALKISTIISLIFIYVIIIYNDNIFSSNTKDIFNLLSTVILIPLIYDSIKKAN